MIIEKAIGSSRFYYYDENDESIFTGYIFFAKSQWGKWVIRL